MQEENTQWLPSGSDLADILGNEGEVMNPTKPKDDEFTEDEDIAEIILIHFPSASRSVMQEMFEEMLEIKNQAIVKALENLRLPKKRYFEPMGGPVSHAESEGYNQSLKDTQAAIDNEIKRYRGEQDDTKS